MQSATDAEHASVAMQSVQKTTPELERCSEPLSPDTRLDDDQAHDQNKYSASDAKKATDGLEPGPANRKSFALNMKKLQNNAPERGHGSEEGQPMSDLASPGSHRGFVGAAAVGGLRASNKDLEREIGQLKL